MSLSVHNVQKTILGEVPIHLSQLIAAAMNLSSYIIKVQLILFQGYIYEIYGGAEEKPLMCKPVMACIYSEICRTFHVLTVLANFLQAGVMGKAHVVLTLHTAT